MRIRIAALFLLSLGGSLFSGSADSASVTKQEGVFASGPDGSCVATLKRSSRGGFLKLYIKERHHASVHIADDVTGLAWVTPTELVYSASPIYGHPGIFWISCGEKIDRKRLVGPAHSDRAYPSGSDYFELKSVAGSSIQYYYGDDVDQVDMEALRTNKNLREVQLPQAQ